MTYKIDKVAVYAAALDEDISAERFKIVEYGKVNHYYHGTVYAVAVATDSGMKFETFHEARENACLFVRQCAEIVANRKKV